MGKKAKEHRKKVAARNAKIKQQKSGMQKIVDRMIQEQLNKMKEEESKVANGATQMDFQVVEDRVIENAFKFTPNEEESAKINKQFEEELPTEE